MAPTNIVLSVDWQSNGPRVTIANAMTPEQLALALAAIAHVYASTPNGTALARRTLVIEPGIAPGAVQLLEIAIATLRANPQADAVNRGKIVT
jgi:hypothetical protein